MKNQKKILIITVVFISLIGFLFLSHVTITVNAVYNQKLSDENFKIQCCSECITHARSLALNNGGDCTQFVSGECKEFFEENSYDVSSCRLN